MPAFLQMLCSPPVTGSGSHCIIEHLCVMWHSDHREQKQNGNPSQSAQRSLQLSCIPSPEHPIRLCITSDSLAQSYKEGKEGCATFLLAGLRAGACSVSLTRERGGVGVEKEKQEGGSIARLSPSYAAASSRLPSSYHCFCDAEAVANCKEPCIFASPLTLFRILHSLFLVWGASFFPPVICLWMDRRPLRWSE